MKPLKLSHIEFAGNGFHLFVSVKVNGKRCRFLIDTGASHTVVDPVLLPRLKTSTQSTTGIHGIGNKTQFGVLKSFSLGHTEMKNFKVTAMPLQHINASYTYMGEKPIQGILGSDVLMKLQLCLNFKTLRLFKAQ